ncbi:rhomboid protease GluP [Mesobacillus persicus]|uniref:Rhomboid protease GluP n=1 Tax=Mesobacillus persicus TaxID=930146 RepID=A0A1H7X494_9BACI|nr:rhomboid family intramembrane serine protease [Mesobacillus persicus]SEM28445.1 rhomboid protease GluP [Mesobacillus persicus]
MIAESLFWSTAHYLIVRKQYRVLQISRDKQEIWLEKVENKDLPIVRLIRYDLDWSQWLQRDIEQVAANGSRIRRRLVRGKLTISNLYFTQFPPVDDYEHHLVKPYLSSAKEKVEVVTTIIDSSNVSQSKDKLHDIMGTDFLLEGRMELTEEETTKLQVESLRDASEREKAEKAIFHSGKGFFTFFLIVIQVAVFILMELMGGSTETSILIQYGAKFNPLILEGEWWRFITPMFIHIGFLHLLMNSLALYYLGPMVERIYGNSRFLFIYILAGFSGVLASFLFSPNLSAGASGAIFGCFGALLYFGVVFPRLFLRSLGFNILIVLAINLMFGFTIPGIDNAGHIGGLVGGFAAAGIVRFPKKKRIASQVLYLAITTALILGLLQYGFSNPASLMDKQSVLIHAQEQIRAEEFDKAYQLLNEYKDKERDSADILFLLSFTEVKRNDLEGAKVHLQQVVELNPQFHEAHYNLSLIYLEQGSLNEAKTYAENALNLQPDNKDYQELVERITSL